MSEKSNDQFVNLGNARTERQRLVMDKINIGGYCPFCPEYLSINHTKPILRQGEHWTVTENQWPYDHTRIHLLAIAAYHAETLHELKSGAFEELGEHVKWAEAVYRIAAGGIALRFGDINRSGATVGHLHAHVIVPEDNLAKNEKVRFKIS